MIIIALIFHKLGHYIPSWIKRENFKTLREKLSWKQYFFEMSGVLVNLVLAFLIILSITLTSKEKYLLNDNAVFGIECSDYAKNIGFKDGDKILSINNQKVDRFSDILKSIILANGDTEVLVQRNDKNEKIIVTDADKLTLIKNNSATLFVPKTKPDSLNGVTTNQLKYNERKLGFKDALVTFTTTVKMVYSYFSPRQTNGINGFIALKGIKNLKGFLYILAINSILIGLINLIPLPGLDFGNTIIAFIENTRKKKFDRQVLRIVRIACSSLIVISFLALIYLT